jgi:hypothetical protein
MNNTKQIIAILNGLTDEYFSGNLASIFSPILVSKNETITIIPEDFDRVEKLFTETFDLISPGPGNRPFIPKKVNDSGAICRIIVSYVDAVRWCNNPRQFIYGMSLAINSMLIALSKELGELTFREATLARPGRPTEYFRDLDYCAGLELRMFVKKEENN